ncbi:iron-containing alcohol dehydrogenase [Sinorhizobium sp. 8-89]|uniref:iron-containing alcohol dehydrogenase n=1 Tax=Sinorhizobium sp. 7-81 TaxID=3049087 RepID=UPI0024C3E131|nr:iron-containing alcohol dehydrogenase [Sinorhizobium sp. 7-81]MDK1389798.1 iron-containing alcohol dehydrogenase [Sinorhizobium sp. 7-81]
MFAGTGVNKHGLKPLRSALIVAEGCYKMIRAHGVAAMRAVERGEVTADVEAAVEAAVLLSCLAFENGGLSIAHAMMLGLLVTRGTRHAQHGEHVAYGLLVELAVEGCSEDELDDMTEFFQQIGLPARLADMGLDSPTSEEIDDLAGACFRSPHLRNVARPVLAADIAISIRRIEEWDARKGNPARDFKAEQPLEQGRPLAIQR